MRAHFRAEWLASPLVAAMVLFAAAPLSAQLQLRGVVRDSASRAPIPGVVLILLDSSGKALGRNLTNERGQYALILSPGMRQLQVLRIGFRPRTLGIPGLSNGSAELNVAMAAIPMLLQPVSVIDQPNCPRRADRSAAFALWEQAKSALLATVVAREAAPASVMRLHFDRRMDGTSDHTAHIDVRIDSASTTRPFAAARPAAEFVDRGFVDDSGWTRVYHSPDADVLLDEAFPRGYCFELASPDRARPREVGLAFKPARGKRNRIDIEGAVWIDTASRALTDLTFRYLGLPRAIDRFQPGGNVSFRSMENGTVIIDRWHIRLASGVVSAGGSVRDLVAHEKGGEVAHARWADGREWIASLGTFEAQAWHGDRPAANTRVRLIDTDYEAVTDSLGGFTIRNLLPGPYALGVIDSTLDSLGLVLATPVQFNAVRDSTIRRSFIAPTATDFVEAMCRGMNHGVVGPFSLVGRVLLPDNTPANGAAYSVEVYRGGEFAPLRDGRTNEQGVFVICSLERNALIQISSNGNSLNASAVRTVTQRIETVLLTLRAAGARTP